MKKVIKLAKEMSDNLVIKTRLDGKGYVCTAEEIEWQKEIIHKIHGDKLPDDTTYEFISEAADVIADMPEDCTEDDIRERIFEIEPDVYTSDLTEWLHRRCDHVYYLTDALEQQQTEDGFQLLQIAQQTHKHEVAGDLLSALIKYAETLAVEA